MRTIITILALAIGLVSCTNRLVTRDVDTGELVEVMPNGHEDYLAIGDTILVQCGIGAIPDVYATGDYIIPDATFHRYIDLNGDSSSFMVYYREVEVLDKVMR